MPALHGVTAHTNSHAGQTVDEAGAGAVEAILARDALCWLSHGLTSSGSPEEEPTPLESSALLRPPHLTITAADSVPSGGGSSHIYSLPSTGASVDVRLPDKFVEVGLGAQVWSSAIGLSVWLSRAADTGQLHLAGTRLLELGAGVGLPGLLCAQLGVDAPAHITLTDLSPQLIDCMQANADRNASGGGEAADTSPVVAELLNWDADEVAGEEYDVIIGADVVYSQAHVTQLVQTVLPRLATGLSTLVLLQPGTYRSSGGGGSDGGAVKLDTRNGWAELKATLGELGSLEVHRLRLSLLGGSSAEAAAAAGAAANQETAEKGQAKEPAEEGTASAAAAAAAAGLVCGDFELIIFRKEVLCLMPPPA
jgi:predicted nicotinamide N-methyase